MKYSKIILISVIFCVLFTACKKQCEHNYQSEITVKASCKQAGVETLTCSLCKYSYTQPISPLEHNYEISRIDRVATCTEEGIQILTCTNCDETKIETTKKVPHTLKNITIIKTANCTYAGQQKGDCTVCGQAQILVEIPTNNTHLLVNTVIKKATCNDPGEGINTCSLCQHSETCHYELTPHNYSRKKTLVNATCTKNGTMQLICTHCGHTTKETITSSGHQWTGVSCTKAAICSVCNTIGQKSDHKYIVLSDQKHSTFFAGKRVKKCEYCNKQVVEYHTERTVINLDEINAAVYDYATSRGLHAIIDTNKTVGYTNMEYKYYDSVWGTNSQKEIIDAAKKCVDAAYRNYSTSPAGIGVYSLYFRAFYHTDGGLGSGYFGVVFDIRNRH